MKTEYKIAISVVLGVLCLCFVTYFGTMWFYENKYKEAGELQKKFDSISVVLSIRTNELNQMNEVYDSVKSVSLTQKSVLDSLLATRKNKRNEKRIKPINDIPDDEINSILSDRLK